jgi:hypothetical protein
MTYSEGRESFKSKPMLSVHPHLPTSHLPLPTSRAALTLAEVLIAMGLMTLGLLGVAAVFPVGGFYMQSGDIADRGGAIAQAALDDAMIQGHLNPENWIALHFDSAFAGPNVNGQIDPLTSPPIPPSPNGLKGSNSVHLDYLATSLRNVPKDFYFGGRTAVGGQTEQQFRDRVYGGAYVIDPIGMTAVLEDDSTAALRSLSGTIDSRAARRFPASKVISYRSPYWAPWSLTNDTWPIRRLMTKTRHPASITTANTPAAALATDSRLMRATATQLFNSTSDLAISLPDSGDEPALGLWESLSGTSAGLPAARQARREYSWIISVTPESSVGRDALATQPDAYPYEVSAVVFNKRIVGKGHDAALSNERLVNARVVSSNPSGGDLLLERRAANEDAITTSPFENLRVGQYLMLTGPHPLSTPQQPRLVLNWYRVLSIEKEGRPNLNGEEVQLGVTNTTDRVLVSLRGPDWPWQPAGTGLNDPTSSLLPNDLRVGILPGVVAVHTKTMRLESATEWSVK